MNKKYVLILIVLIGTFLLSISILIVNKSKAKAKQEVMTMILPEFFLKKLRKENLTFQNTASVFIAFSPDCEHCQYEAKSINERQKDLQNINIVLFTSLNDSLTKSFSHTYGLDTIKNIHVVSDEKNELHQHFGVKTIPTVFICDAAGKLLKQYNGETKIDAILKTLASTTN